MFALHACNYGKHQEYKHRLYTEYPCLLSMLVTMVNIKNISIDYILNIHVCSPCL